MVAKIAFTVFQSISLEKRESLQTQIFGYPDGTG